MTKDDSDLIKKALAKKTHDLDLVPKRIDPLTMLRAGHKEAYLLKMCKKHSLTWRQLDSLIQLKNDFQTTFHALLKLTEQGYTADEIEEFFQVRDCLTTEESKSLFGPDSVFKSETKIVDAPSIKQIVNFCQCFDLLPIEANLLAETILTFHKFFSRYHDDDNYHMDSTISRAIRIAKQMEVHDWEHVYDWLTENYEQHFGGEEDD